MDSEALTQKEAAERLGVSPSTLRRKTKSGEVPRNDDGSYPWPAVRDALEGEQLTQKEAAERLGITSRRLRQLTKEELVTRLDDGSYPWPAIEAEYHAFLEESQERRAAGFGDESYERARARKVAAQARLAELDAMEREGELVPAADVEVLLRRPLEGVNAVLKAAPSKHATRLAKAAGIQVVQAKLIISDIVEAIRTDLREVPDHAA